MNNLMIFMKKWASSIALLGILFLSDSNNIKISCNLFGLQEIFLEMLFYSAEFLFMFSKKSFSNNSLFTETPLLLLSSS